MTTLRAGAIPLLACASLFGCSKADGPSYRDASEPAMVGDGNRPDLGDAGATSPSDGGTGEGSVPGADVSDGGTRPLDAAVEGCGSIPHLGVEMRTRRQNPQVAFGETCYAQGQVRTCRNGSFDAWSGTFEYESCVVAEPVACGDAAHGTTQTRDRYGASEVLAPAACAAEQQTRTCSNGTWSAWSGKATYDACSVCIDADGDGFGLGCAKGRDCDDGRDTVNPNGSEVEWNSVDEDCDGKLGRRLVREQSLEVRDFSSILHADGHVISVMGATIEVRAEGALDQVVARYPGFPARNFGYGESSLKNAQLYGGILAVPVQGYETSGEHVRIHTFEDPLTPPREVSRFDPGSSFQLSRDGRRLYGQDAGKVTLYDLGDPAQPRAVGSFHRDPESCWQPTVYDAGQLLLLHCLGEETETLYAWRNALTDPLNVPNMADAQIVAGPVPYAFGDDPGLSVQATAQGIFWSTARVLDDPDPAYYRLRLTDEGVSSAERLAPATWGDAPWAPLAEAVAVAAPESLFSDAPHANSQTRLCLAREGAEARCTVLEAWVDSLLADGDALFAGGPTFLLELALTKNAPSPFVSGSRWTVLAPMLWGAAALDKQQRAYLRTEGGGFAVVELAPDYIGPKLRAESLRVDGNPVVADGVAFVGSALVDTSRSDGLALAGTLGCRAQTLTRRNDKDILICGASAYDVSNPLAPVVVASGFDIPEDKTVDVVADDTHVFVATIPARNNGKITAYSFDGATIAPLWSVAKRVTDLACAADELLGARSASGKEELVRYAPDTGAELGVLTTVDETFFVLGDLILLGGSLGKRARPAYDLASATTLSVSAADLGFETCILLATEGDLLLCADEDYLHVLRLAR